MQLVVVGLAVAAAAVAVEAILRTTPGHGGSLVAVVTALALVVGAGTLWDSGASLRDAASRSTTSPEAEAAGGRALAMNVEFLAWAQERMDAGETFFMPPAGPGNDVSQYQWATYQLFPSLSVARPEDADWIVFYELEPRSWRAGRRHFGAVETFAPGFALARGHAG